MESAHCMICQICWHNGHRQQIRPGPLPPTPTGQFDLNHDPTRQRLHRLNQPWPQRRLLYDFCMLDVPRVFHAATTIVAQFFITTRIIYPYELSDISLYFRHHRCAVERFWARIVLVSSIWFLTLQSHPKRALSIVFRKTWTIPWKPCPEQVIPAVRATTVGRSIQPVRETAPVHSWKLYVE